MISNELYADGLRFKLVPQKKLNIGDYVLVENKDLTAILKLEMEYVNSSFNRRVFKARVQRFIHTKMPFIIYMKFSDALPYYCLEKFEEVYYDIE